VVGAEGVEAVLQDVVVDGGKGDRTKLVAELVDPVELIGVVGLGALVNEERGLIAGPNGPSTSILSSGTACLAASKSNRFGKLEAKGVAKEARYASPDVFSGSRHRRGCRRGNPVKAIQRRMTSRRPCCAM